MLILHLGKGANLRRKALISGRINNGLFDGISNRVVSSSDRLIENFTREIQWIVYSTTKAVRTDFDVMCRQLAEGAEDDTYEDQKAAIKVQGKLDGWQREMDRIKETLEEES